MEFKSRWLIEVPNMHLATLVFTSPTHPISKTEPCFIDAAQSDTRFLTRHDFRLWSQRFAAGLRKSGLRTGSRVLFVSGNSLFFPVVYMGILMAGGIFSGANPAYIPRELAYQLKDSGATYLICAASSIETGVQAAKLAGLSSNQVFLFDDTFYGVNESPGAVEFSSQDYRYWGDLIESEEVGQQFAWDELSTPKLVNRTLALNYSSGTTGIPKGVELSHKNIIANIFQYNYLFYLQKDHRERIARAKWLCLLPMYHAMAQNMFISIALMRGVPVYIMEKYDFVIFLQAIEQFRITDLILVPPIVVTMAKRPETRKHDLSSVETIFCGAAPLGREVSEEAEALWPDRRVNIKQGWGMTEYVNIRPCSCFHAIPLHLHHRRDLKASTAAKLYNH
jgi:4-coumarate--CoA ligase